MPSLIDRISNYARSPQGKKLMRRAERYASDPKNRARIEQVRRRLSSRGRSG